MIAVRPSEQQVFSSIKRACYAGLDSTTLRAELVRRAGPFVPADASSFATTDPDTWLINHTMGVNMPAALVTAFLNYVYPDGEAVTGIDQVRSARAVELETTGELLALMRAVGLEYDLRGLFFNADALWGSWCMMRQAGSPFTDREVRFMERIAPHVTEGLRQAAVLDLAADTLGTAPDDAPAAGPGFLIVDPRGRVTLRTPAAAAWLDDMRQAGSAPDGELPYAVLSVRSHVLRMRCTDESAPADARVRARGRSGAWYSLRATLAEPDVSGESSTVIAIEPLEKRDVAPLLFRLYGLSPRERQVVVEVVRGEPTKRIAQRLGLSIHTVQDYLDKACDKIGVRGRKALVAKFFRDGYAPELLT